VTFGEHETVLYPLYHPAAALYNARLRPELEADIARIPALMRHLDGLASGVHDEPIAVPEPPTAAAPPEPPAPAPELVAAGAAEEQLGLF
jgi:hypothetical protein